MFQHVHGLKVFLTVNEKKINVSFKVLSEITILGYVTCKQLKSKSFFFVF